MKSNYKIIISASAAAALAVTVLAQDAPPLNKDASAVSHKNRASSRAERLNDAAKASEIIGMEVKNNQGDKLGKVSDIALDLEAGRVVQVILSTGGFLGMGGALVALPPGALHRDTTNGYLHLDASQEMLKAAPKFEASKSDDGSLSNQVVSAYTYFGEQPYFATDRDGGMVNNRAEAVHSDANYPVAGNSPKTVPNADGKTRQNWHSSNRRTNSSSSSLGYVQNASMLMGKPVVNLQNEKLGKVENFLVDLPAGRIVAVVISSGGFIGIGDELSAVPPAAFAFNTAHDALQLNASKELLSSSPHFKSNEWPDLSKLDYASGVYRAYQVEPYFIAAKTSDVDNTRLNVRDRDSRSLTPLDQGNSSADIGTTAQIRKEIIANKGMSVNAKNVKIITYKGQVTLRGPVNTPEEKRQIGEIAERVAHSENVDNQLEVKLAANDLK